jgi:hypothetical protein
MTLPSQIMQAFSNGFKVGNGTRASSRQFQQVSSRKIFA